MNLQILIFILIFGSCKQIKSDNIPSNLDKYYEATSQAEVFIVCKKFHEASQKYKEAFKFKEEPFLVDLYNSMYSNHLAGNTFGIFNDLKSIVKISGISLNCIKNAYAFATKYEQEFKEFEDWYPLGLSYNKSRKNTKLTEMVIEMDANDQKFRGGEDRYTVYKEANSSMDSINFFKVLSLLRSHGYPKESEIGVYEEFDFTGFDSRLETVLIHCFQSTEKRWYKKSLVDELDSILEISVKQGRLHTEELFEYRYHKRRYERNYEDLNYYELPFSIINNNTYVLPIDFEKIDSINQEFKKLYLDPVEIQYFKAKYILENRPLKFFKISERGCCNFLNLKDPSQEFVAVQILGLVTYGSYLEIFPDDYCK